MPLFYEGVDDYLLRQAVHVSRCLGYSVVLDGRVAGPLFEHVIKEPILKSAR